MENKNFDEPQSPTGETPEKPDNFDDILENLVFQKKNVPMGYQSTLDVIRMMAEGGEADGIREEYYPGWTDDDFKKLLKALGEKA